MAQDKSRGDVKDKFHTLYKEVLELFKADHPDYVERLSKLQDNQEN